MLLNNFANRGWNNQEYHSAGPGGVQQVIRGGQEATNDWFKWDILIA